MYHKMPRHNLACGQKPNMSSTPIIMAITLVPRAPYVSPLHHLGTHDCLNPWWVINCATLMGHLLPYRLHHSLIPCSPEQLNQRKIKKRQKAYEYGWKNEGRGNSCIAIAPFNIYTSKTGLPSL